MAEEYFNGISPDANIPETGTLSVGQLESLWGHVGGDMSKAGMMAEIAIAESGGRIDAVSSSGDYGLWQINRIHFGYLGLNSTNVFWPHANAVMAMVISSNGSNIAAWCTAWANPDQDCGHGYLGVPQVGSAVWRVEGGTEPPPSGGSSSGGGSIGSNVGSGLQGIVPDFNISGPSSGGPSGGVLELQDAWSGIGDILTTYNEQLADSWQLWLENADAVIRNA